MHLVFNAFWFHCNFVEYYSNAINVVVIIVYLNLSDLNRNLKLFLKSFNQHYYYPWNYYQDNSMWADKRMLI